MDITIYSKKLSGTIDAIASKSFAHRALICAAFADAPTQIFLNQTNRDIEATALCLRNLGVTVERTDWGYDIQPADQIPCQAVLPCAESGSTLRFMLPVVGALGVDALFTMEGRLPQRPLSPLLDEIQRMGCHISKANANVLHCTGKLIPGQYAIAGNVSSQFITGFLLAFPLIDGCCNLQILGKTESAPYIAITKAVLNTFDAETLNNRNGFTSPGKIHIEGDWSNAAFFLCANKLGNRIQINNLNENSVQGDRRITEILDFICNRPQIDCTDIPDLVPILAVTAAATNGATLKNIARLRLKESDRVQSVTDMIHSLGGKAMATENDLTVYPGLTGGKVNSFSDHRIAMAAAIAATVCKDPVVIENANCVSKSYPTFWNDYKHLGGNYEQHIRPNS